KRAVQLPQPLLREAQVERGGDDALVAEQQLNGTQIDAGFEHVGGEAMAQRVEAMTAFQTGAAFGVVKDLLGGAALHGTVAYSVGEQPVAEAVRFPVAAQCLEEIRR